MTLTDHEARALALTDRERAAQALYLATDPDLGWWNAPHAVRIAYRALAASIQRETDRD